VQRFAAQIEEAILQADIFRIVRFAENRQRQFLRCGKHLHLGGENLDLTGFEIGVHGIGRARLDLAVDANDPFATYGFSRLESRRIRIRHDLRQPVMVAQVDEQQAAMIANAMHPARNTDIGADIGLSQLRAGVAAITMHCLIFRLTMVQWGRSTCPTAKLARKAHGQALLSRREGRKPPFGARLATRFTSDGLTRPSAAGIEKRV
jgi:hypothetical protein